MILSKRYKSQPASCLPIWSQKHASNSQEMHLIYICISKGRILLLSFTGSEPYGEQLLRVMTTGCCMENAVSWGKL